MPVTADHDHEITASAASAGRDPRGALYRHAKRLLDFTAAAIAALLLAPLIGIVALVVRCTVGSPVLFRQRRPGYQGRSFTLVKFRTMGREQRAADGRELSDDERLGVAGRRLRRFSLDELPQLWNVLCGDMSLVGPRPLLEEYLPLYSQEQRRRHAVSPGITGWCQVTGRNALSWEEKLERDVWYVDHCSFWLDVKILVMTVWQLVRPRGVSHTGHATMPRFEGTAERKGVSE